MIDSHRNGAVAESVVEAKLHDLGYAVSIPTKMERPYDFIAEIDASLVKVQVKSVYERDRGDEMKYRADLRSRSSDGDRSYDGKDVDAFALFNPMLSEVYWLWFSEAPSSEASRKRSSWREHRIDEKLA